MNIINDIILAIIVAAVMIVIAPAVVGIRSKASNYGKNIDRSPKIKR